jgi:F0F1-type ATP synthase assembly protein I
MPMKVERENKNAMMVVGDGVLGAAVLVIIGVNAGNWLDDRFHTAPAWSFALSLLGGGAGLWRLVAKANSLDSNIKSKPDDTTKL